MEERCVRCLVQLQLHRISWPKEFGQMFLKGPPVFIRVCLLGQLQQTELYNPLFPINLNIILPFDRIFTNCKVPSLLPEVVRGEHIKIELVQINEDYTGGKLIARYDSSAASFLFSENSGHSQYQLVMDKSRHYQSHPLLTISTNVTMSEAIVQSPVKILTPSSPSSDPAVLLETSLDSTHQRLQNILHKNDKPHDRSHDKSHDRSQRDKSVAFSIASTLDHSCEQCPRHHVALPHKKQTPNHSPVKPFAVPRPDPELLAKREFYSCSPKKEFVSKTTPTLRPTSLSKTPPPLVKPPFSSTPLQSDNGLYNEYLGHHGNRRHPLSKVVQNKLDQLLRDCSDGQEDSHCLEDCSRDQLANVRTTLEAERQESLNKTAQFVPDDSLLTKLGPRDYWSKRVSEYSGKPHRLVFDETLEKIYSRLYSTS